MNITAQLERLPIFLPNIPIDHLGLHLHKHPARAADIWLGKEIPTFDLLSTLVIFVFDNRVGVVEPAVDEQRGGVFSDMLWEVGGDFDEVGEVPDTPLIVGFWVFDGVDLVTAERRLGVEGSSVVSVEG